MGTGRIIFLNGTSSAGKSTLVPALRAALPDPFCYYASDQLAQNGFRTIRRRAHRERSRFFDGFHRSILSFAAAGNDLIVEHIVEEQAWADQLRTLLNGLDVFWVGVHASLPELERRERERGDRSIGEAAHHLKTHDYCTYDVEVDTGETPDRVVASIIEAWRSRPVPL